MYGHNPQLDDRLYDLISQGKFKDAMAIARLSRAHSLRSSFGEQALYKEPWSMLQAAHGLRLNESFDGAVKEYGELISLFDGSMSLDTAELPAYVGRGLAYSHNKDMDSANSDWATALKAKVPEMHDANLYRGVALLNLGRAQEALISFDSVAEFRDSYTWMQCRANALDKLGRLDEADELRKPITDLMKRIADDNRHTNMVGGLATLVNVWE